MAHITRRASILIVLLFSSLPAMTGAQSDSLTSEQRQVLQQLSSNRDPALSQLFEKGMRKTRREDRAEVEAASDDESRDVRQAGQGSDADERARLKVGDTILLKFENRARVKAEGREHQDGAAKPKAPEREPEEKPDDPQKLEEQQKLRAALLPAERLFVLDQFGGITLKNIGRIVLSGLNEEEAAERLAAEPALH